MTEHLRRNEECGSHMCVSEGKISVYETTKDLSQLKNAQVGSDLLKHLEIKGQIAVLVSKESMLIIDKDKGNLYSIRFGNQHNLEDMKDKFPPLNSLDVDSTHGLIIMSSEYRNFAISRIGRDMHLNLFFSDQKEWSKFRIKDLNESEKAALEPLV